MHATNPQPISSHSVASELITRHLQATEVDRRISPAVVAMVVGLILIPLVLLLASSSSI
jgi:hypothetical protein